MFQEYFKNLPLKIVGIGITAFNRVGPGYFLPRTTLASGRRLPASRSRGARIRGEPGYEIICYKDSLDVPEIEKKCRVIAIERDFKKDLKRLNSLAILKHPDVQQYLNQKNKKIGLFLYKSTKKIEKIADQLGWQIVTNRSEIRDPYENKKIFREVLKKVGVEPVPGGILPLSKFSEQIFEKFQRIYGQKLVLQLPEVTKGGGRGNTFIDKKEDLGLFWKKVKRLGKEFPIKNVIIAKFISGVSPSITGCATRHGILTGVVQAQITDIPEVINIKKGAGLFVGHDWSFRHYSEKIQKQAERIARRFGEYIYQKGYRGIFGIDLLVEKGTDKVYPCECNPRYTGAFPVYSMIQWKLKEPSFDVFQLLEHLKIDYPMNFKKMDKLYKQKKEGAQLILYNKTDDYLKVGGEMRAGVYKFSIFNFQFSKLEYIRPGFAYEDIKNSDEFVLTDGVPRKGEVIRPGLRILKLIFPKSILIKDGKSIDKRTKLIVEEIYKRLKLQKFVP